MINNKFFLLQETTTASDATKSRGWTDSGQVDLFEKVDIPDREINETVSSEAKKEGDNITSVRLTLIYA